MSLSFICHGAGLSCHFLFYYFSVYWLQAQCKGDYSSLYGGVVSQAVKNVTAGHEDVVNAVKLAVGQAKLNIKDCSVTNLVKQRLYYSKDGISPTLHSQVVGHNTGSGRGGKPSIQQRQLVLGLLYTFLFHCHMTSHDQEGTVHRFSVTRDRNNDYHIFRWTAATAGVSDLRARQQCRNAVDSYSIFLDPPTGSVVSQRQTSSLRVASFNIWNVNFGMESYESRMERLCKLIKSLNVDIFGFQEVRLEVGMEDANEKKKKRKRQPTRSQVAYLTSHLEGYQFVFQPAMLYMEKILERNEEGLAIFSRYPIISSGYRLLYRNESDGDDFHQRICLHAEVLTQQFGIIHTFVTHLSLSAPSQERSVVEIWQYMKSFSGIKFLLGDMNAEPDSSTIRFLTGKQSLGGVKTENLFDSWDVRGVPSNSGLTFSALERKPVKRIDYIFASLPDDVQIALTNVTVDNDIWYRIIMANHKI